MSELSRQDAVNKRNSYVEQLSSLKNRIDQDFQEMDFQNARQRNLVMMRIEGIKGRLDYYINWLTQMNFY